MATYYGYAERKAENDINWAEVGKNITDMLDAEVKIREDKKAAIDKSSKEFGETLANSPQGQHQGINQWTLNYASNAQEARLLQDKLLKQGKLKLRDYNIMRQNLTDGTTQAFSLIKEYNVKAEEKLKRMSDGLSAAQEQYEMEQIEGFGNFTNTELYINPTDYSVSVGKKVKGEDGVMMLSKNPNDFSSISSLRNQMNNKIDKYNVIGNLKVGVDALGKKTEVVMANGVKTRTSPKNLKDYNKVRDTYIDSLMTNSVNVGSILTDYVKLSPDGVPYGFTRDESNTDPNKILLVADPMNPASGRLVPKLTSKQEKVAKDALISQFDAMIDEEDTARAEFAPQRELMPSATERMASDMRIGYLQDINKIISGDPGQFEASVRDRIEDVNRYNENKNINSKITKIDRGADKISIYFEEPEGRRVEEIVFEGKDAKTIGQEISRYLTPGMGSFGAAYKDFEKTEGGFSPLPAEIAPASRGLGFTQKPNIILTQALINPADKKSGTIQEKFDELSENAEDAGALVNQAIKNSLSDITSDVTVEVMDEPGLFAGDAIKVTIDGQLYDLKYKGDNTKLSSEVQNIINERINLYNSNGTQAKNTTPGRKLTFPEWKSQNPTLGPIQYKEYLNQ